MGLDVPIIIVTGAGSEQVAVDAMKAGANDYLIKDSDRNYLKILPLTLNKAIKGRIIEDRIKAQSARDSARVVIIGDSAAMQDANKLINLAAASDGVDRYRAHGYQGDRRDRWLRPDAMDPSEQARYRRSHCGQHS